MARPTSTTRSARACGGAVTPSRPAAIPKWCSARTSNGASDSSKSCTGCSPSRSGTRATRSSSSLASGSGFFTEPSGRPNRCVFGSELKAFAAHGGVPRELDAESLAQYLAVEYVPAPRSIHRHVFKLPAAHVAVLDERGFRLRRYWELPAPSAERIAAQEAGEELVRLLDG